MSLSIQQALDAAKSQLPSDSAALDAELLLGHVIGKARSYLFAFNDAALEPSQLGTFNALIQRAAQGEPIAYIIGSRGFWDLDLHVTPDVLIPRPDTEILIEILLTRLAENTTSRILDLGTGSGAIALALKSSLPQAQVFALDYSYAALKICQSNSASNQLNLPLIHGSWLDAIKDSCIDVIVSNPPYINSNDSHLSALKFEPYNALVADDNGFSDYKAICAQASNKLRENGLLIFEHGFEQADELTKIMKHSGFTRIETFKDYGENDRVTLGYKSTAPC